ncbi:uncharacterized protein NEMAJ01_0661 [Nematocida major]|uniref:uncharacterized protein n=1 Tax=Nematocida major TaxID=1912982 RepID=UPI0020087ACA|nr:uncharacterized protein NEMAJ01_0661 [Nematocida major]KAH9385765.1 hypothetical protein NEMAJ01_0661 [Nematocida major]
MIHGMFMVSACGALVYQEINRTHFSAIEVDKLIAMASTVYTAMEILTDINVCTRRGKYARMSAEYELFTLTALKTQTGLIFGIIHDKEDAIARVVEYADQTHRAYIDRILYSPEYYVDERISKKFTAQKK